RSARRASGRGGRELRRVVPGARRGRDCGRRARRGAGEVSSGSRKEIGGAMKERNEPEWVVVASVGNDEEASLIAGLLQSRDIPCEVEGPSTTPWPENLGAFGMSRALVPPANAIAAVRRLGTENGFPVDATEDPSAFTDVHLAPYRAVLFLLTTGDVLGEDEQAAFERWIRSGGGWVGVHSATDTEYEWPFYGEL